MPWVQIEGDASPQVKQALRDSPDWLTLGTFAFGLAGLLAMVATWHLVPRYPGPADDAIHLGLLGFCFFIFFALFIAIVVAATQIRKGQHLAAAKWSIGLILAGLLVASLVGVLPWLLTWLFNWLTTRYPWVPSVLRALPLVVVAAHLLWGWKARRARRST